MKTWPDPTGFACFGLAALLALPGCAPTLKAGADLIVDPPDCGSTPPGAH